MIRKAAEGHGPVEPVHFRPLRPAAGDLQVPVDAGKAGAGGEIQLTDAMLKLMSRQKFWGMKFEGETFDTGSKIGFLAANVAYGLSRPELAADFRKELKLAWLEEGFETSSR